jgi:hypothetical protein
MVTCRGAEFVARMLAQRVRPLRRTGELAPPARTGAVAERRARASHASFAVGPAAGGGRCDRVLMYRLPLAEALKEEHALACA